MRTMHVECERKVPYLGDDFRTGQVFWKELQVVRHLLRGRDQREYERQVKQLVLIK